MINLLKATATNTLLKDTWTNTLLKATSTNTLLSYFDTHSAESNYVKHSAENNTKLRTNLGEDSAEMGGSKHFDKRRLNVEMQTNNNKIKYYVYGEVFNYSSLGLRDRGLGGLASRGSAAAPGGIWAAIGSVEASEAALVSISWTSRCRT